MMQERRLHPRANVDLPARILRSGRQDWDRVLLTDISAGGAAIRAAAELPLQSELRLRFTLPGAGGPGEELDLHCLVVRNAGSAHGGEGLPVQVGLLFLALPGEAFEFIRQWVWSRLE